MVDSKHSCFSRCKADLRDSKNGLELIYAALTYYYSRCKTDSADHSECREILAADSVQCEYI